MKYFVKNICLFAFVFGLFISADAWALWGEQREAYTSASFLGRGGAMSSDVSDYNAVFVNPAGLVKIEEPAFNVEFQIEGSTHVGDNMTALFGYTNHWHANDAADIEKLRDQNTRAKLAFLAMYMQKNFAVALVSSGAMDMAYDGETVPNVHTFAVGDIDLQMSASRGFLENERLRIGATAKILYRTARTGYLSYNDLATIGVKPSGPYTDEGLAFSFDVGSQYSWYFKQYELSVALSALDLATPYGIKTKFLGSTTGDRPPIMPARVVAGAGFLVPNVFSNFKLRTNLDIVKSLTRNETSILDWIHWGVELKFPMYLAIRGGFNQGYWTAGLSVTYWWLEASFATYAENTAIYDKDLGRMQSNRRYLFQFSFLM